ncbi:MAG: diguanylate cyclase [Gammaproteobacteria bacterium]|nr:diguanylate cyclase [Gammaproteobacteria bacterium]
MHDKSNLRDLIGRLDPSLIERSKSGKKIKLSALFEAVAKEYLQLNQKVSTDQQANSLDIAQQLDPLTRLPNRNFFTTYVQQAIKRAQRSKKPFALVFIDVDHFKQINDNHGHRIGDQVLQEISARIQSSIRDTDLLCRLAGDEFCLLIEELDIKKDILRVVEAVKNKLAMPMQLKDESLTVTSSLGVSLYPDNGNSFEQLLHFADLAMYEAKRDGRNSVRLFTEELSEKIETVRNHQSKLNQAIRSNHFNYLIQPELELHGNNISAIRQHIQLLEEPQLSEPEILDLARRSSRVTHVGRTWIAGGCQQIAIWQQHFTQIPRLALPLYREMLATVQTANLIAEQLNKYRIDGNQLEFEIDESELLKSEDQGYQLLKEICMMGCKISLINFEVGPSSLKLLSSGFIEKIKMGGELIDSIAENDQSRLLMEALVEVCNKFSINTVALNVHNVKQVNVLTDLGCGGIRGNYVSAPIFADEFTQLLDAFNQSIQDEQKS